MCGVHHTILPRFFFFLFQKYRGWSIYTPSCSRNYFWKYSFKDERKNYETIVYSSAFFAFVISGCYSPHFLPNTAPTPMFEKAGNIRIAGYAGTNSYDVHVGVSPVEHIGLLGAGSVSFNKKVDNEENNKKPEREAEWTHAHRYYEGALGYYFSPFTIKNDLMKIEIFAGYGAGTANGSLNTGKTDIYGFIILTTRVDADYRQYYLQLNAAISEKMLNKDGTQSGGSVFEGGSVFRLSKTELSNFERFGQSLNVSPMTGSFAQFCVFGILRGSGLGLTMQVGWLFPIGNDQNRPAYSPLYITAGLGIDLW